MPRPEVMRHMLVGENVGLCVGRAGQVVGGDLWNLVYCSLYLEDFNLFYRGGSVDFPLYLHPDTSKKDLFSGFEPGRERNPNLNPKVVAALQAAYGQEPTPEDIFSYVYAVLYAPAYREKYAAFLKTDFPRLPFTANFERFQALAALGKRLVDLHLLRSEELDPPAARFQGKGDSRVARGLSQGLRYEPKEERVYINKTQYFAPVPLELWEYQIGGYQVLEKWLKDRQDRPLTLEEIKTYCRVVTAIQRTIALQEEIDALYPEAEARIVSIEG
jgi:predicted helicase